MDPAPPYAAMRPFGDAIDLDLDFDQPDRPGLVTALLSQCGEYRDPVFWWAQPVGVRTAALLELVAHTDERDLVSMSARCAASACGEAFEFELPLRALAPSDARDAGPIRVQLPGDRSVTMRRPTGDDLRRWRDAQPVSRAEALRLMLDSLVFSGHVQPDDAVCLSELVATMDPLVAFTVLCSCPACATPNEVPVDLESLALRRLATRQRALLQEVHGLASRYGWTESEVLAVPRARREFYLSLIQDAA